MLSQIKENHTNPNQPNPIMGVELSQPYMHGLALSWRLQKGMTLYSKVSIFSEGVRLEGRTTPTEKIKTV